MRRRHKTATLLLEMDMLVGRIRELRARDRFVPPFEQCVALEMLAELVEVLVEDVRRTGLFVFPPRRRRKRY
jgi:hypothetical protein